MRKSGNFCYKIEIYMFRINCTHYEKFVKLHLNSIFDHKTDILLAGIANSIKAPLE